jgi:hypothetical protein
MKVLVIIFAVCLACNAEDVKPAKAIAVLGLSNSIIGSKNIDIIIKKR